MAYQKLQVGLGVNVIPSDTINIPNVAGPTESGTVTSVVANHWSFGWVLYPCSGKASLCY